MTVHPRFISPVPAEGIRPQAIDLIKIAGIRVPDGRRPVQPKAVEHLAETMATIGLKTPITVRLDEDGNPRLVAGAHRLAAAKRLGWDRITCFIEADQSGKQARQWELSENLHRVELSALERAEHIAEWIKLTDELKGGQVAQVSERHEGGRGHEGGISAAARALSIPRSEVQRSKKIAGLSPKEKETARDVGLDNNQSALLAAAREPQDRQATALRDIAAQRESKPVTAVPCDTGAGTSRLADWIVAKAEPDEIEMILSWLESEKPKDVIDAVRRAAARPLADRRSSAPNQGDAERDGGVNLQGAQLAQFESHEGGLREPAPQPCSAPPPITEARPESRTRSEGHSPASPLHQRRPLATNAHHVDPLEIEVEIEERKAMAADSVPEPYLDAWARLQVQKPMGVSEADWRLAIDAAGRFLDQWGSLAVEFGWTPGDLFDVTPDCHTGGLIWFLNGEDVRFLGPDHPVTKSGRVFDTDPRAIADAGRLGYGLTEIEAKEQGDDRG